MTKVLFFHAPWCRSCSSFLPTFKEVAKELESDEITFRDLDVEDDEGNDLSSEYKVRNVPTILVIKNDEVVDRITGTRSHADLMKEINKFK